MLLMRRSRLVSDLRDVNEVIKQLDRERIQRGISYQSGG